MSQSSDSFNGGGNGRGRHRANVEVVFPSEQAAAEAMHDAAQSGAPASVGRVAGDGSDSDVAARLKKVEDWVAKALAELPADLAALAKDPDRKAKSKDPGWKYGFWPVLGKKEVVQCIFCKKEVNAGIKRFKQHLAGGYGDAEKCPRVIAEISKEMGDYLKANSRTPIILVQQQVGEDGGEPAVEVVAEHVPSSGTNAKVAAKKRKQATMASFVVSGTSAAKPSAQTLSKSVSSMLCKTPEQVVDDRHSTKASQSTLEHCTKKTKEARDIVDDHVADFFFENKIAFNAVNSRSFEIMLESIGQYGPGYRGPSYHRLRVPLLEKAVNKTMTLREKHEEAWKEYGGTLMSDGWTDTRHRHVINFLANSPAGTFFLGSVDASGAVANATMLADLLEEQINKVGREYVVQITTDNGANFKAAGKLLMERIPTLFWTPCAAHCLDLMLEDFGKIKEFQSCINQAKKVTNFIYKHGRLLDQMRAKIGGDLVRHAVTRFATSFLTLASMRKHKSGLRSLFVSDEWHQNKLSTSTEGQAAEQIVLSVPFWVNVKNCLRASQPVLIALRIADGDETPGAPEITAAMEISKNTIKNALKDKPALLKTVMGCFDKRWDKQMEQNLYGAALFLNPTKYFTIREQNKRQAARLRIMFNDVLWKMIPDEEEQNKISEQADDYDRSEGEVFSKPPAIRDRTRKNPILWWGAYGGLAYELQCLAKRIVSLCCSASGCERNWSTFSDIHTKKRNRLEHQRLNKLVFVSYNRKMTNRFTKIRELGSQGKACNPLILEDFQWDSEWVNPNCEPVHQGAGAGDDLTWAHVDEATGASQGLRGRNLPRAAAAAPNYCGRKRKNPRVAAEDDQHRDIEEENPGTEQEDGSDDPMDEDEDGVTRPEDAADEDFQLDDSLLG